MHESTVPPHANVISSYVVYRVKNEENNVKRLKSRLCPRGNRNAMKGDIRNDASNTQFNMIRLMLSLACILQFALGCVDIKSAYLQSGPITREIYVRPPKEWQLRRSKIWKLLTLPYEISEAGRQWAQAIEKWLLLDAKF